MRFSELLDAYAEFWDRILGPVTDDTAPSPERTKPDNTLVELPPCPDDCRSDICPWRVLKSARERPLHELVGPLLADATETIPNPLYSKETPIMADPTPGSAWRAPDGTLRIYATSDSDDRYPWFSTDPDGSYSGWLSRGEVNQAMLTPLDDRLGTWETNVLAAARAVASGDLPRSIASAGPDPSAPTRSITITLDDDVVDAEVVGSSAWLYDLADQLQQYGDLICMSTPEQFHTTPRAIRAHADQVERDERQTARDTRDWEQVEPIVRERWNIDRKNLGLLFGEPPAWDELTDEQRAPCIDHSLRLYRAGRDDVRAAMQPGSGGCGGSGGGHVANGGTGGGGGTSRA